MIVDQDCLLRLFVVGNLEHLVQQSVWMWFAVRGTSGQREREKESYPPFDLALVSACFQQTNAICTNVLPVQKIWHFWLKQYDVVICLDEQSSSAHWNETSFRNCTYNPWNCISSSQNEILNLSWSSVNSRPWCPTDAVSDLRRSGRWGAPAQWGATKHAVHWTTPPRWCAG